MTDVLDETQRQALFPALDRGPIFLNHAGIAPVSGPAARALARYAEEAQRPDSEVLAGWLRGTSDARRSIARLIGAHPDEIAFVPNTTVGVATVARGLGLDPGDRVIGFDGDYPANVFPWRALVARGVEHLLAPAPNGVPDLEAFARLLDERTRVVAVSSVCFWSGARAPLADIVRLARSVGALVAVDGVQSVGALRTDVVSDDVDFLACGGLKWLLSPMGVAFLYVRRGVLDRIALLAPGADSYAPSLPFRDYRERWRGEAGRHEGGTQPTGNILAMGASIDMLLDVGPERVEEQVLRNSGVLAEALRDRGFEVISPRDSASASGIVAARHPDRPHAAIVEKLAALGVRCIEREGFLRMAPHFYQSEAEMERVVRALRDAV